MALEVRLSSRAASVLARLTRERRGRLILQLAAAARSDPDGLFSVWVPDHLAACESGREAGLLLVYAIVSRAELMTELVGERAVRRARAMDLRRALRARIS